MGFVADVLEALWILAQKLGLLWGAACAAVLMAWMTKNDELLRKVVWAVAVLVAVLAGIAVFWAITCHTFPDEVFFLGTPSPCQGPPFT